MAEAKTPRAAEAPCSSACPCGTDIHGFMNALAKGGEGGLTPAQAIEEAFYIIADRNPIPAIVGRLCPHHCETNCAGDSKEPGVPINQVERAIAEAAINAAWPLRTLEPSPNSVPVTVIGAGAAGLSAAYQLARRGYEVTLADPHAEAGGELRYGVRTTELPAPVLNAEVERVLALGVTFAGTTDVKALRSKADHPLITTPVYQDGAPVAFEGIAAAVQFGRQAAELLDQELRGRPASGQAPVAQAGRTNLTVSDPKRQGAETIQVTLSADAAAHEAQRCLTCGGCVTK